MTFPAHLRRFSSFALALAIFAFFSPIPAAAEDVPIPECGDAQIALSTYYASLSGGALGKALRLHTSAALQDWKVKGSAAFKSWALNETRKGSVKRVRILDTIEGESAFVEFEVQYADGSKARRKTKLAIENGCWKVGVIQGE